MSSLTVKRVLAAAATAAVAASLAACGGSSKSSPDYYQQCQTASMAYALKAAAGDEPGPAPKVNPACAHLSTAQKEQVYNSTLEQLKKDGLT